MILDKAYNIAEVEVHPKVKRKHILHFNIL